MTSAFFGLNIAARALAAQQQALETVAHNIANANTPGYSRQNPVLVATPAFLVPTIGKTRQTGQVGSGVEVSTTRRVRDAFLDGQVRHESLLLGQAEVRRDVLRQVEQVYNEPSDSGLQQLLSKFWAAWQELSSDPSGSAQRANLREQARSLASAFNQTAAQLGQLRTDLDRQVELEVGEVNSATDRLAALNSLIARVEAGGDYANDLRDERDLLLDRLHHLLPVDAVEAGNGQVSVFFQCQQLVSGDVAFTLRAEANPDNGGNLDLTKDGQTFFPRAAGGRIGGAQQARDVDLTGQLATLDTMAVALRDAVNTRHRLGLGRDGQGNRDFFAGGGAFDLAVGADIEADLDRIAAAAGGEGSAGAGNALAIAALQNTAIPVGDATALPGDYYASIISRLGVVSRSAANAATNQEAVLTHLERQRQEVSGVSLDEETVQMIQYQRAYEAAARVVTVTDELLDHLINRTGLAGR